MRLEKKKKRENGVGEFLSRFLVLFINLKGENAFNNLH